MSDAPEHSAAPLRFDRVPSLPAIAAGGAIATVLALTVAAQAYLSMLGHGHSFRRILAWQLTTWGFWACAAPLVLRRGARLMAERPRTRRRLRPVLALGLVLFLVHSTVAAQLTLWIQPFVPVETYDLRGAWLGQLPAHFVTDVLMFGLLLTLGAALWTYRRARALEVRESRLEAELARAQLHALRLEIEPHFLFNTLNAITALVRLKDNARAVDMLVGLGEFMRHSLDRSSEQTVPLSSEIAWMKRYVTLQQARFADRLDVRYRVAEDCLDCPVPALLLQPVVENALRHGLGRQLQRCTVELAAVRDLAALQITVLDDGVGLPVDFDLDRQSGTGLRNVRSRLQHLYGSAATFDISRTGSSGTRVTIRLPFVDASWQSRATA
jgi:two-component system, LytTR family, sensor kinase